MTLVPCEALQCDRCQKWYGYVPPGCEPPALRRCPECCAEIEAQNEMRQWLRENLRVIVDRDKNYNELGGHDSLHDVRVVLELREDDGQWVAIDEVGSGPAAPPA